MRGEEDGDARNDGPCLMRPTRGSVSRASEEEGIDGLNDGPRAAELKREAGVGRRRAATGSTGRAYCDGATGAAEEREGTEAAEATRRGGPARAARSGRGRSRKELDEAGGANRRLSGGGAL